MEVLERIFSLVALCVCLLPVMEGAAECPTAPLAAPTFGQLLLYNGSNGIVDITRNKASLYTDMTRVEYRCANGSLLFNSKTNDTLNQTSIATCTTSTMWLNILPSDSIECRLRDCGAPPSVPNAGDPSYSTTTLGSEATYTCNNGYSFTNSDVDRDRAVCNETGGWSHVPTCTSAPTIGRFETVVIVAAALGGLAVLFLITTIFLCIWVIRLKLQYSKSGMEEAEVTLARAQKIYTLPNPLSVSTKDEDSALGKPLYLTPDEMNALDTRKNSNY